jgi:hypothetical protein
VAVTCRSQRGNPPDHPLAGTVTKIKMLKRQMYRRASLDLLRKRVILHPG